MPFAYESGSAASIPVIRLSQDARSAFLRRTYTHLFLAVAGFVAFELFLFNAGLALPIARGMLSVPWLLILGAFMVAGWLARSVAASAATPALQYAALGGYVVAQGLIFVPVLVIAHLRMPGVLPAAALTTIVAFAALTAVVFVTRKDFSFMRGILTWGGILALVLIVAAALFGFELGVFFSVAMVAFAGAAILYDTSNVLHHYPEAGRRRGARAVRVGGVAVLVHPASVHEPQVPDTAAHGGRQQHRLLRPRPRRSPARDPRTPESVKWFPEVVLSSQRYG